MYHFKLLGLVLSAMLTLSSGVSFTETPVPVETPDPSPTTPADYDIYDGSNIHFPFTRLDEINWHLYYDIDDLGETDVIGGKHDYNIRYTLYLNCSSACALVIPQQGYNINENVIEFHWNRQVKQVLANDLLSRLNNGQTAGFLSESYTYANDQSFHDFNLTVTPPIGGNVSLLVRTAALSTGSIMNALLYQMQEFGNFYFVKNFLTNKDNPPAVTQTVKNYIDNGYYNEAVQYITNYYITNSVTENTENETIINNYNSKETNLNTVFDTENNFSNTIENDFQTQQLQLPNTDQSIEDLQDNNFLQSANWVTQQFNRMTVGNVFGKFLVFSLFTGFILALIGRFRK